MNDLTVEDLQNALEEFGFSFEKEGKKFVAIEPCTDVVHEFDSLKEAQAFFNALEAAQRCQSHLMLAKHLNHQVLLRRLSSVLNDYSSRGIALEIGDFANELGMLLGRNLEDKQKLIHEFNHGFKHGVDLSDKLK